MTRADMGLRQAGQLRNLCLSLEDAGFRMRARRRGRINLLGQPLSGVFSATSVVPGYEDYYLQTAAGDVFEISKEMAACTLPSGARPLDCREVLHGPSVVAVFGDDEFGTQVLLSDGRALQLVHMLSGNTPTIGLDVASPKEAVDWRVGGFGPCRRIL